MSPGATSSGAMSSGAMANRSAAMARESMPAPGYAGLWHGTQSDNLAVTMPWARTAAIASVHALAHFLTVAVRNVGRAARAESAGDRRELPIERQVLREGRWGRTPPPSFLSDNGCRP